MKWKHQRTRDWEKGYQAYSRWSVVTHGDSVPVMSFGDWARIVIDWYEGDEKRYEKLIEDYLSYCKGEATKV